MVNSETLTHLYKEWQATASHKDIEFVDEVFSLCERNYEAGGDRVVECFDPKDILAEFWTLNDAKSYCKLHVENAMNYRWGENTDPEVNRPAWKN